MEQKAIASKEATKANQQGLTNYSTNFEPISQLSKDENNLLFIKYQSKPLGLLSDVELLKAATVLLLKIHAITGWTIPGNELKIVLIDQFIKKIKESYPNVNEGEVEYAFRQNFVQDWGKSMNLSLIDEVLSDYLEKRSDVSRAEARYKLALPAPPIENNTPMTDEETIEMYRSSYKVLKTYRNFPEKLWVLLFAQKKIKKPPMEDREQLLKQATHDYHEELRVDRNLSYGDKEKEIRKIMNQILCAKYFNSLNGNK